MAKKKNTLENPLCTLHEAKGLRADLYQDGEQFRVSFEGGSAKDRLFESLPALLSGLQGIFLEIRMGGRGLRGLDALAKARDAARQDVLAASRKIHSALGTV